jgi:hypothetical protein
MSRLVLANLRAGDIVHLLGRPGTDLLTEALENANQGSGSYDGGNLGALRSPRQPENQSTVIHIKRERIVNGANFGVVLHARGTCPKQAIHNNTETP